MTILVVHRANRFLLHLTGGRQWVQNPAEILTVPAPLELYITVAVYKIALHSRTEDCDGDANVIATHAHLLEV